MLILGCVGTTFYLWDHTSEIISYYQFWPSISTFLAHFSLNPYCFLLIFLLFVFMSLLILLFLSPVLIFGSYLLPLYLIDLPAFAYFSGWAGLTGSWLYSLQLAIFCLSLEGLSHISNTYSCRYYQLLMLYNFWVFEYFLHPLQLYLKSCLMC